MKKYSFAEEELGVLNFHISVKGFHESLAANYIRSTVAKRLGIKPQDKIQYDVQKNELIVEPGVILPNKKEKK